MLRYTIFFDILLLSSFFLLFFFLYIFQIFYHLFGFIFEWKKSNKTLWTQQTQKKKDTEILQDKVNLCLINRFLYLQCGFKYKRIR